MRLQQVPSISDLGTQRRACSQAGAPERKRVADSRQRAGTLPWTIQSALSRGNSIEAISPNVCVLRISTFLYIPCTPYLGLDRRFDSLAGLPCPDRGTPKVPLLRKYCYHYPDERKKLRQGHRVRGLPVWQPYTGPGREGRRRSLATSRQFW